MSRRGPDWRAVAVIGVGVAVTGALGATAVLNPTQTVDVRHCAIDHPPGETLVIAFDTSDPLVAAEPHGTRFAVQDEIAHLEPGDRVLVLDAAGEAGAEAAPIIDQCDPGDDDNIARNAFRRNIVSPVAAHLRQLSSNTTSNQSPIIETILSVTRDPSLHIAGSHLRVLFVTDGMQNTAYASAYHRKLMFPKPDGRPLSGVVVRLVLIKNVRDLALQPRGVVQLRDWLVAAGARVEMSEPGWLLLAQSEQPHGKKR